jgi:hypothetical protein
VPVLNLSYSILCCPWTVCSTCADPGSVYQLNSRAGIFKKSMGARHRVGIGLLYRPARLHRLAEFIPWNRFRGPIHVQKYQLSLYCPRNCMPTAACAAPGRICSTATCTLPGGVWPSPASLCCTFTCLYKRACVLASSPILYACVLFAADVSVYQELMLQLYVHVHIL